MPERVVVTGVGVLTQLGDSPEALAESLWRGRSGLAPFADGSALGLEAIPAGRFDTFEPRDYLPDGNLRPLDRTGMLAAAAASLALRDGGLSPERLAEAEVGLVLGTMFGSIRTISEFDRRAVTAGPIYAKPLHFANSVINAAAGQSAIWHRLTGTNATICGDVTSGLQAIGYAADLIRDGLADALLAGGADELCPESLYGFLRCGRLCARNGGGDAGYPIPFDRRRNGFALAEGAALLVLESETAARRRGAAIRAEIAGFGSSYDCSRGGDESSAVGSLARAIDLALADARVDAQAIDFVSASASGSPSRDKHEARGVERALNGRGGELPVTAIKSALGESLGASSALQSATALSVLESGRLPGIAGLEQPDPDLPLRGVATRSIEIRARRGLVTSVGLEGKSCALVMRRPKTEVH